MSGMLVQVGERRMRGNGIEGEYGASSVYTCM
jgi:hypothetical protein